MTASIVGYFPWTDGLTSFILVVSVCQKPNQNSIVYGCLDHSFSYEECSMSRAARSAPERRPHAVPGWPAGAVCASKRVPQNVKTRERQGFMQLRILLLFRGHSYVALAYPPRPCPGCGSEAYRWGTVLIHPKVPVYPPRRMSTQGKWQK